MKKFRVKAYVVEFHNKLIEANTQEEAKRILQEMVDMNKFGELEDIHEDEFNPTEFEEIEINHEEDLTLPEEIHWMHEGSEEFNLLDRVSRR